MFLEQFFPDRAGTDEGTAKRVLIGTPAGSPRLGEKDGAVNRTRDGAVRFFAGL